MICVLVEAVKSINIAAAEENKIKMLEFEQIKQELQVYEAKLKEMGASL